MSQNTIAKTILVIEDDAQLRKLFRKKMEGRGYEIIEASNGKEGIDRYREKPSDLVITDIVMPEKEGLETISELRKIAPDVRIIAISGGGRIRPESYLETASHLGADRIFSKPLEWPEMYQAMEELLKES
ncbi:MAG: response regulator [Deltaproteobacteria bacterium]|nr:MAG: response regulator [Deltaproteobacteria bacterium]